MALLASTDVDVPLSQAENFRRFTSGAELNVATGSSRLGLPVDYITALGTDPNGDFLLDKIRHSGIGTEFILRNSSFSTGVYFKDKVASGDPQVLYLRKNSACANLTYEEIVKSCPEFNLSNYSHAHLTGIYPAISDTASSVFDQLITALNAADVYTSFDPNLRPKLWQSQELMIRTTNEAAHRANLVLPGVAEGQVLVGSEDPEKIADFYLENGRRTECVVVKLGSRGAYFKTNAQESGFVDGLKVAQIVSTVGAGDGFAVGMLSGLMSGKTVVQSVQRAVIIGALAVTSEGDSDGYPTAEQLRQYEVE
jgi:2-dehydro-3-deoxygluconokinase